MALMLNGTLDYEERQLFVAEARAEIESKNNVTLDCSEVGAIDIHDGRIVEKGRLGPGQMIAVDTRRRQVLKNRDIKLEVSSHQPYGEWLREQVVSLTGGRGDQETGGPGEPETLASLPPVPRPPGSPCAAARRSAFALARARSSAFRFRISAIRCACGISSGCSARAL